MQFQDIIFLFPEPVSDAQRTAFQKILDNQDKLKKLIGKPFPFDIKTFDEILDNSNSAYFKATDSFNSCSIGNAAEHRFRKYDSHGLYLHLKKHGQEILVPIKQVGVPITMRNIDSYTDMSSITAEYTDLPLYYSSHDLVGFLFLKGMTMRRQLINCRLEAEENDALESMKSSLNSGGSLESIL